MNLLLRLLLPWAKGKAISYGKRTLAKRSPEVLALTEESGFLLRLTTPKKAVLALLIYHTGKFLLALLRRYFKK